MSQPSRGRGVKRRGGPRSGGGQRQMKRGAATGAAGVPMHLDTPSSIEATPMASPAPSERDTSHLSDIRFDSLAGKVDPNLLSAIPFPYMSLVQAATLDLALSGVDVLAQAKTGTGKTVAFLLPAIQKLLTSPPATGSPCNVSVLILSPTRELALQIEKEAKMLLTRLGNRLGVQHCIGGTNMDTEKRALQSMRCDLLVATPGRLVDHLKNGTLGKQLRKVRTIVLDEADRMLDMGFRQNVKEIVSYLSPRNVQPRQSLLFSATIPSDIREVADLDKNCVFVNTLKAGEENTHEHVPQEYLIVPSVDTFTASVALIEQCFQKEPISTKAILFFSTAAQTALFFRMLEKLKQQSTGQDTLHSVPVFEVHSRKSQAQRIKASAGFSTAQRGILCSSDVTARGVDFPGVTNVIQIGLPQSAEQYIHRLGRTARAGASGSGILLLSPAESFFLRKSDMKALSVNEMQEKPDLGLSKSRVERALLNVSDAAKASAYQGSMGFYKNYAKDLKWSKVDLVREMNHIAKVGMLFQKGQPGPAPPVLAKTLGKMGMRGTSGIHEVKEMPSYMNE